MRNDMVMPCSCGVCRPAQRVVLDVDAPATDLYASSVWEDVFYDEIENGSGYL